MRNLIVSILHSPITSMEDAREFRFETPDLEMAVPYPYGPRVIAYSTAVF